MSLSFKKFSNFLIDNRKLGLGPLNDTKSVFSNFNLKLILGIKSSGSSMHN